MPESHGHEAPGPVIPGSPLWDEFAERLEGPGGCNFRETVPGDPATVTWTCAGGRDKSIAARILAEMGLPPAYVEASLAFYDAHGGHCDCEILFNVESSVLQGPGRA